MRMAHTIRDKKKMLNRIREFADRLKQSKERLRLKTIVMRFFKVLPHAVVALNGLMVEIIDGHVNMHVIDPNKPHTPEQHTAADQLMDIVRAYLK